MTIQPFIVRVRYEHDMSDEMYVEYYLERVDGTRVYLSEGMELLIEEIRKPTPKYGDDDGKAEAEKDQETKNGK